MWLLYVIAAHLLNALVFIVDKVLLGRAIKNPTVYAVIIGLMSGVVGVLIPVVRHLDPPAFQQVPPPLVLLEDLASGAFLILALIAFFGALKRLEASRLIPFVGALIPLATFIVSFQVLGERLTSSEVVAFLLLVSGGVFITLDPHHPNTKSTWRGWMLAMASVLLFTGSFVSMKHLFNQQVFWDAFIWSRFGSFVVAVLILLFHSSLWAEIRSTFKRLPSLQIAQFLGNQALGALGFIILSQAINLAPSVTIVNALQGVQYVFVLLFVVVASIRSPKLLKEQMTPMIILEKCIAIALIAEGLVLLK